MAKPNPPRHGLTVEPSQKDRKYGKGSSDSELMKKLYPKSPLNDPTQEIEVDVAGEKVKGKITSHQDLVEFARKVLTPKVQSADPMLFPGGKVNLDYQDSPDLMKEVKIGGGGRPAHPFAPNIAPFENPDDPTSQPAFASTADEAAAIMNPAAVVGQGSLISPSEYSEEISSTEIGTILPGGGHAGSDGVKTQQ